MARLADRDERTGAVVIEMSFEAQRLEEVVAALQYESDGKQLRKEMTANLRAAIAPAIPVIKAGVMSMGGHGSVTPALRTSIASRVRIATRATGARAGVRVSIGRTPQIRGFRNAPKRLNADSFRHPVFGNREKWVTQRGAPGYFDRPLQERQDEMRAAVVRAVEEMSERIARRAGKGA